MTAGNHDLLRGGRRKERGTERSEKLRGTDCGGRRVAQFRKNYCGVGRVFKTMAGNLGAEN